MLQHVFLDIISLDSWIVALVTTETPLPWMCWHVLYEVSPLCGVRNGLFHWTSEHVPFENISPWAGISAVFATIRLSASGWIWSTSAILNFFMICVFSVCWRLQSIGIIEKNKVILAKAISWSGTLQWWQLWWWWWYPAEKNVRTLASFRYTYSVY